MVCAAPCEYSTGDYMTITCVSTCMSLAGRQGGRGAGTQAEGQGGEQAVGAPGKTAWRRCAEMSQMPPPKNSVTCAAVQF